MASAKAPVTAKGSRQPAQEILDDLCSRFILNGPREDLQSGERLLFVVEQAHWYYEDTVREQHPDLRSFSLRDFTVLLFQKCAALKPYNARVHEMYDAFNAYKVKVPVGGAIILDASLQWCLLVKGWKAGASWGFPKGKKSKDEEDHTCAIREVLEETGFDVTPYLKVNDFLESSAGDRRCRLYMVPGVDMGSARFQCQTKKEISEIAWHFIGDLVAAKSEGVGPAASASKTPAGIKLYLVQPFARDIAAWVARHQTPSTRAAAALQPATPGKVISAWKARDEMGNVAATPPEAPGTFQQAELQGSSAGMRARSSPPVPASAQLEEPPFASLHNFKFNLVPIMSALEFH